jgi:hypothetical protein
MFLFASLKGRIVAAGERVSDKESPQSPGLMAGMAMKEFHVPAGGSLAVLALALGFASAANAQQAAPRSAPAPTAPLGFTASRASAPPPAAKYEDSVSQRSFVLDRSGDGPLLKFDDSPEVYALRATSAQRGDDFLRNDAGDLMLRVTEAGNVIAYVGAKTGAPADIAGVAAPLDAPAMTGSLTQRVKEAAANLGKMAGHDVTIFGTGAFGNDEEWASDALMMTVMGVQRADKSAHGAVQGLKSVRLVKSTMPTTTFHDGELLLGVNPLEGYAGRPSSEAVAKAIAVEKPRS